VEGLNAAEVAVGSSASGLGLVQSHRLGACAEHGRERRVLAQRAIDLADNSSGKTISIALFDSEENMNAAEKTFDEDMPRALGDLMEQWSGRRTAVERYEVVYDFSTS
jgi:hypothetical protein